jgi:hypothetical protein
MAFVVYHLVLVCNRAAAVFSDEVFHAAGGPGGDLPFELQIEIVERVGRDDVAAVLPGKVFQPAVLNDPACFGERGLLETAPSGGRFAIEERVRYGRRLTGENRAGEDQQG